MTQAVMTEEEFKEYQELKEDISIADDFERDVCDLTWKIKDPTIFKLCEQLKEYREGKCVDDCERVVELTDALKNIDEITCNVI